MLVNKILKKSFALRKRILDLSLQVSALHIGGSFSSAEIIQTIFELKKKNDKFILSKGHVGILLYCILEQKGILKKKRPRKLLQKKRFYWSSPRKIY